MCRQMSSRIDVQLLCLSIRIPNTAGEATNGTALEGLSFGRVHDHSLTDKFLPRLVQFSAEEAADRLARYFKFMFVREPLERLVSAYRDKMIRDSAYRKFYVPKILTSYRPGYFDGRLIGT